MSTKKNNLPPENAESLDQNIAADCQKCAEYLAGWKRAVADYENLQKDTARKQQEFSRYAHEQMLLELLPAIDQFETALSHLPDLDQLPMETRKPIANWIIGIKAVSQLWEQMFQNIGLERVDAAGAFDPIKHNAVGKEEDATKPQDAILQVIQTGWKLKDTVIRPAKVIVNQLPATSDKDVPNS